MDCGGGIWAFWRWMWCGNTVPLNIYNFVSQHEVKKDNYILFQFRVLQQIPLLQFLSPLTVVLWFLRTTHYDFLFCSQLSEEGAGQLAWFFSTTSVTAAGKTQRLAGRWNQQSLSPPLLGICVDWHLTPPLDYWQIHPMCCISWPGLFWTTLGSTM